MTRVFPCVELGLRKSPSPFSQEVIVKYEVLPSPTHQSRPIPENLEILIDPPTKLKTRVPSSKRNILHEASDGNSIGP